jgi:hypothetical protein
MSSRNTVCRLWPFGRLVSWLKWSSALILIFQIHASAASKVTLELSPITDTNAVGCKIYYGLESHNYTQSVDAKTATNVVISLPAAGATYYFAATTYDSAGNESAYSREVTYVAAGPATLTSPNLSSGQFQFTVTGTSNAVYVVEASTNLVNWVPIQTNTAPFTFVEANTSGSAQNFYRAVAP